MSNPKVNSFSLSDADKLSWDFEKIYVLRSDISSFLSNFDSLSDLTLLQLEFFGGLLKSLVYVTNTSLNTPYSLKDFNDNLFACLAVDGLSSQMYDTYSKLKNNEAKLIEVGELIILMSDCYKMMLVK